MAQTLELVLAADEAGADIFELGVPFTDAFVDGSLIREASSIALRNGVSVRDCLSLVEELRRRGLRKPILAMGYLNPFLAYGPDKLSRDARRAGLDGFIIPDLPPEYAQPWRAAFERDGLVNVLFLTPTTTEQRMKYVVSQAGGFLYCLAANGLTGPRSDLDPGLQPFIERARTTTELPLAVGYGISTPAQVARVSQWADAVVVGSVLVSTILNSAPGCLGADLAEVVRQMAVATVRGKV